MKKYIVWLSENHGEYIDADQVRQDAEILVFEKVIDSRIKEISHIKIVARYNLKNILGYNEVEEN